MSHLFLVKRWIVYKTRQQTYTLTYVSERNYKVPKLYSERGFGSSTSTQTDPIEILNDLTVSSTEVSQSEDNLDFI